MLMTVVITTNCSKKKTHHKNTIRNKGNYFKGTGQCWLLLKFVVMENLLGNEQRRAVISKHFEKRLKR